MNQRPDRAPQEAGGPNRQELTNVFHRNLGLAPDLLRAVAEQGYTEPTPVQREAIPLVLAGRDVLAAAQTGTGKTAAFVLPILQRLTRPGEQPDAGRRPVRVLVVTPTRELCLQVEEAVRIYSQTRPVRSLAIYGGMPFDPQVRKLLSAPEIVVATPGRLLDHVEQRTIDLLASRCSSSMRATACSTWVSSPTCAASSACCPSSARP